MCLDDLLWVAANDANGQKVRCGIVVDTEAKARERVLVCQDFARQLGIDCVYQTAGVTLVFPNGSEIMGITAGGRRAGASMTFHRFHFTEVPFWRQPTASYTSLMQALVLGGRVIIETTMGIDDPLAKDLWQSPNDYFKRFFSFEDHEDYKMDFDRAVLSEDLEEYLKTEGFTDIRAMTYWAWLLNNRCGGDMVRCFREYPQKPEHSWMFAEGRWIRHAPKIVEPIDRLVTFGAVSRLLLNVFLRPSDGSGHYCIGVDTSAGMGRDRSAVVVVDRVSDKIMASFVDEDCKIDDLVQVAKLAQETYTTSYKNKMGQWVNNIPPAIIESNGIGTGTLQEAQKQNIKTVDFKTSKVSRYDGLLYVKRFVESGVVFGPEALAEECDDLRVEDDKFKGKKDLCMALGFCYTWMANQKDPRGRGEDNPNRVDMVRALEDYYRRKKKRG